MANPRRRSIARFALLVSVIAVLAIAAGFVLKFLERNVGDDDNPKVGSDESSFTDHDDDSRKDALGPIRLSSPELAERIGIATAPARTMKMARRISGNAETAYDARKTAKVFARVPGIVAELHADPHQRVRKGELIAVLDAAVVGTEKAQYLSVLAAEELAEETMKRVASLAPGGAISGKSIIEARTSLNQAKISLAEAELKLLNFGLSQKEIQWLAEIKTADNRLEIRAPIDGSVVAWAANIGEAVEPTSQLFGLADTSSLWLWIDVYEPDIAAVQVGQPASFQVSGEEGRVFSGPVIALSTEVNPTTRSTRVRAVLPNPEQRLRANQFGRAEIQVESPHDAIVVPIAAVQNDGTRDLVFLPKGDGVFIPQLVQVRPANQRDVVEIVSGVVSGQQVVTTGSFLLFSQLYKDKIIGDAD